MRRRRPIKAKNQGGFTIVELLVVLPIYILVVMVTFSSLLSRYGQLLKEAAAVNLRLEAETSLVVLEDELIFATDFGEVKSSDLTDAYAPSGGWSYNTNPDTLIIYETALTAGRRDPARDFVYKNTYGCSSNSNPIAINNLIYFTKPNTTDSYKTLYKRSVVPAYATCQTNYRKKSCPESVVVSGCTTDGIVSRNVVDFDVIYYDDDNVIIDDESGSPDLSLARKLKVTLTLGDKANGEDVTVTSAVTMKRLN
jgi:type II secretory pathway pseudopilin PulG